MRDLFSSILFILFIIGGGCLALPGLALCLGPVAFLIGIFICFSMVFGMWDSFMGIFWKK
ncbi:MAG: hypothetical protein ABRQ37_09755 [Candidatus Eremiobacterota bacterium]